MQIIPVIDIRGGLVVHATGGQRRDYPLLSSVLTQSVDVMTVLEDILAWTAFKQIYIADLDAIEKGQLNLSLYEQMARMAGDAELWLDAGLKTGQEIMSAEFTANLKLVLGSETLTDLTVLEQDGQRRNIIVSLDYKQGRFLGLPELLNTTLWPQQIIVMNLDKVGADKGPALEQLVQLMRCRPQCDWYAAGGVRDIQDLMALQKAGAAGVLVASALHSGKIEKLTVDSFLKQN